MVLHARAVILSVSSDGRGFHRSLGDTSALGIPEVPAVGQGAAWALLLMKVSDVAAAGGGEKVGHLQPGPEPHPAPGCLFSLGSQAVHRGVPAWLLLSCSHRNISLLPVQRISFRPKGC